MEVRALLSLDLMSVSPEALVAWSDGIEMSTCIYDYGVFSDLTVPLTLVPRGLFQIGARLWWPPSLLSVCLAGSDVDCLLHSSLIPYPFNLRNLSIINVNTNIYCDTVLLNVLPDVDSDVPWMWKDTSYVEELGRLCSMNLALNGLFSSI